jgi:hypothetical protein
MRGNCVRALSKNEIANIVQEGKRISEKEGTAILDQFEKSQPELYQAIFGTLSDGIAEENLDMAHLFLDLCFDIIWIYKNAFGNPPMVELAEDWFSNKVGLLDAELKSLSKDIPMNAKFRKRLNERFIARSIEAGIQLELLQYLDEQVQNYASFNRSRKKATHITNNLLFVVARLMDELYSAGK